jgi:tetratricopeptide (TPR) repeat protein
VNRLRGALEDSADHPRFIEGLPRRGYRFISEVTIDAPPSSPKAASKIDIQASVTGIVSPRWKKRLLAVAAAFAVTGGVLLAVGKHKLLPEPPIEKRSIVLADFTNTTGDPIFEDTLRQGLASQLEQSPFFDIVSDERIAQTLRLMGQSRETRISPQIANEICIRRGDSAWVEGSIANLEGEYVVGLRAVSCQDNQALGQVQVTSSSKKQVLRALGSAATQLRSTLGESLASMKKFDSQLDQATTPSLEALQAYSLGRRALWKNENATAVLLFRRATQLDPNFAMAYASLGMSYMNLGEAVLAAESTKRAYELDAQVSEREKFYIESHYLQNMTGDLQKACEVYELWAQTYPDDVVPHANLGGIHMQLGHYERALREDLQVFRLDSANASNYGDRVVDYMNLNRLEEAETTAKEAASKNLDSPNVHTGLYRLAFLRNDGSGIAQQVSWGAGKPGIEDIFLALEAETAAYGGRLTTARGLSRQAVLAAQNLGDKETAANYEVLSALRESLMEQPREARKRVTVALVLSKGPHIEASAALALALIGDSARAQRLADDLATRFPENTIVQFNHLPTIRAQVALDGRDYRKAIAAVEVATPYELGKTLEWAISPAMCPVYVRAQAYLGARDGNKAAIEFQKILDHPGVVQNNLIGALAHLGLARAQRLKGDRVRARAAYQDFLILWKNADPDIPILKRTKAEYAELK